jgi:hypothetical protein
MEPFFQEPVCISVQEVLKSKKESYYSKPHQGGSRQNHRLTGNPFLNDIQNYYNGDLDTE